MPSERDEWRDLMADILNADSPEQEAERWGVFDAAISRATADTRRLDWLQRQVYDSERSEIGDVTIYGTWGGASVQIGNGPDRGLGETVREAIDAAMQFSAPNEKPQDEAHDG